MEVLEVGEKVKRNRESMDEYTFLLSFRIWNQLLTNFSLGNSKVCHSEPTISPHQKTQTRHSLKLPAERRSTILNQILEPEAVDRLGRIRLVKESRAVDIENRLIMLAQSGQLRQKVTEEQLKDLLNAISENQRKAEEEQKIVVTRRKGGWDDDDDDLLDL